MTPEVLQGRLVGFAVRAGKVTDALPDTRQGRHIAGQLVRCSTSAAPNYAEGCAAESHKDFVHKLSICLKELREAYVWLQLIVQAGLLPEHRLAGLIDEADQLRKILAQSLLTAKRKHHRTQP